MKKSTKTSSPDSQHIPIKSKVLILRPNQWANLAGEVEHFENGIHLIRTSYPGKPGTFLVSARLEELKALSETRELSK